MHIRLSVKPRASSTLTNYVLRKSTINIPSLKRKDELHNISNAVIESHSRKSYEFRIRCGTIQ